MVFFSSFFSRVIAREIDKGYIPPPLTVGHLLATLSARIRRVLYREERGVDCVPEAESGERGGWYDNVVSYVSASNRICSSVAEGHAR